MVLNVIHRLDIAHAQMDGRELTAANELVLTIFMVNSVTKRVNAKRKIPKCAIHGTVNVIARLAGAATCAIVHAHS